MKTILASLAVLLMLTGCAGLWDPGYRSAQRRSAQLQFWADQEIPKGRSKAELLAWAEQKGVTLNPTLPLAYPHQEWEGRQLFAILEEIDRERARFEFLRGV